MPKTPFFSGLHLLFLLSCNAKTEEKKSFHYSNDYYDLSSPAITYTLPEKLKEISGIQFLPNETLACVQDEKGEIFIYNLISKNITGNMKFGRNGDYEDITKAKDAYYIIRSDGSLFKFLNNETKTIDTELTQKNNTESICYDPDSDNLLIGCKEGEKEIYAYEMNEGLNKNPIFRIEQEDIYPTAMGINPATKDLYILSKKKLLIASKDGIIKETLDLKRSLFFQPEGISFRENGDMFIANEGHGRKATILEFKFNQK